jgi:outer membrane protein assembly factor BamB
MKYTSSLAGVLLLGAITQAGNWPQFRGANGNGVGDEKDLPTRWSKTENIRWKAEVPGRSVASPVVFDGRAYVVSASGIRGDRLHVTCFDTKDGKQLWTRQLLGTGNTGCHPKSSMAAPTPCASADGVFVLFATADLAAFDKDGNLKWYRSLTGDYPKIANQVGMASSPILWNDSLIIPMDSDGESFLAAIDTKYGRNIWKIDRPKGINWVSPTLRQLGSKAEILFQSGAELVSYDVTNGKKLWTFPIKGGGIVTPVVFDDKILVAGQGLTCLKPKENGAGVEEMWRSQKLGSGSCTPLVYKDRVYNINSAGSLISADLKTGKDVWQERLKKGKYWASPIAGDDKIYAFNDEGWCSIVQAGGEMAANLTHIEMKEAAAGKKEVNVEIMGTPAIADGAIYIQTVNGLYCIGSKK